MRLASNLRIGPRLAIGFMAIIALMVVLTAVGMQRVWVIDQHLVAINQVNNVKQRHAINFRGSVHDRAIALRDLVLADEPVQQQKALHSMATLAADYADSARQLQPLVQASADAEEKRLLADIVQIEATALPLLSRVQQLQADEQHQAATTALLTQAAPALRHWLAAINAFIDLEESKSQSAAAVASSTARGFALLMILCTLSALLLGAGIAWLLTRSVVAPLQQSLQLAERINAGNLDSAVLVAGKDEAACLLRAMQLMQQRLRDVIAAQHEMAQQHAQGQISYRMAAQDFPGDYGRMVADTNALVDSHVQTQLHIASVMGDYAIGNLAPDIDQYPGEKAAISRTLVQVKNNLQAINQQIQELCEAAGAGNFSHRGQPERFEYAFRHMVQCLDSMMATADGNLAALSALLRAIVDGDLRQRMHGDYQGVFAGMRDDANATVARLTDIVQRIQLASSNINDTASQISAGNQELSQRSAQQAASLQQTTAAMDELTRTVRSNADDAGRADRLAIEATDVARQGGEVVGQVVQTMAGIEDSSRRIAEIINVIDSIAFQTNILALNAAVESARAGEQGRGFAVVASEVRTLAQRSAASAREIRSLIDASVTQVAIGADRVQAAGTTMGRIVDSVQQVTDIMGGIATASQAQTAGIEQVNHNVADIGQATAHNAARVRQAQHAAQSLQAQAGQLQQAVAVFRI
jgi:methyl-accepting chemotaxis protein